MADAGGGGDGDGTGDGTPTVIITAPGDGETLTPGLLLVEGEAADDGAVSAVMVTVGPNAAIRASTTNNYQHFTLPAALPPGRFEITAVAIDDEGLRSEPSTITVDVEGGDGDDGPPVIAIVAPEDGSTPAQSLALVTGTTMDDGGVVAIDLELNGEPIEERPVETSDFFANWARLVPLVPGEQNLLVFTARDAAGQTGSVSLTLEGPVETDRDPPVLTVTSPMTGDPLGAPAVDVRGEAQDNVGIREVKVRVAQVAELGVEPDWGEYILCESNDGYATFTCSGVPVGPGALVIEVKAVDLNGLVSSENIGLFNDFVPEWSDEVGIPLRIRAEGARPVLSLVLDREGVDEVLSEEIQRDTRILELETDTLLNGALDQIKDSCGTAWRLDDPNPNHDCSGAYGDNWQSSPEYSFVRILTMTPANVVVDGTSIEALKNLANQLNLGGGFREILADALGIPRTQEIVGTAGLVRSLQDFFMADHPSVLPGAKIPVTLYDAMHDLNPMSETLGPQGGHPGIVDPQFPVYSEVFTPDFEMHLEAESNLRWKEGIVTSALPRADKDYIAVVDDEVGPTYDDVLEFDFQDPNKFDIQGLAPSPTIDLRFALQEAPIFVDACTAGGGTCQGNLPSAPLAGYIWARPSWEAETVVTGGAFYQYENRSGYSKTYYLLVPAATVTVGANGNPAGWATFRTLLNLGDPPPNQYVWELISEVAQVALHNFGNTVLAEGDANAAFTLQDIDVGLTADEVRDAVRPELQAQRAKLSEQLLGDYAQNNGAVDFYYGLGEDDAPYVFFVAPGDPLPDDAYDYRLPGFFSDVALTTKASTMDAGTSGDATHEKLALPVGETVVYMESEDGAVHRLRFVVENDFDEIQVYVSRRSF